MTREQTAQVLTIFSVAFPNKALLEEKNPVKREELERQRINVWHMVVGHLDFSVAKAASVKLLQTAKFEPKPAELIEAAESLMPKTVPDTESAWIEVCKQLNPYKAPHWSHPLIAEAVEVLGYRTLCDSENPEWDRQHFIRVYERMAAREKDEKVNQQVLKACGLLEEPKLKVLAGGLPDKR